MKRRERGLKNTPICIFFPNKIFKFEKWLFFVSLIEKKNVEVLECTNLSLRAHFTATAGNAALPVRGSIHSTAMELKTYENIK